MDYSSTWNIFLDAIKVQVTPIVFNAWFKDTFLINISNGIAYVIAPYAATKSWLTNNYYDLINETLNKVVGNINDVKIFLKDEYEEENKINQRKNIENIENNKQNDVDIIKKEEELTEYVTYNNLKKEYTFDNFVVGNSNRFAFMSALQVAEKPAAVYNPLFIYGRSGLGKTHLMHAIGNYIVENSEKKVLYIFFNKNKIIYFRKREI